MLTRVGITTADKTIVGARDPGNLQPQGSEKSAWRPNPFYRRVVGIGWGGGATLFTGTGDVSGYGNSNPAISGPKPAKASAITEATVSVWLAAKSVTAQLPTSIDPSPAAGLVVALPFEFFPGDYTTANANLGFNANSGWDWVRFGEPELSGVGLFKPDPDLPVPSSGWINIGLSIDTAARKVSQFLAFSDLGPSADVVNNNNPLNDSPVFLPSSGDVSMPWDHSNWALYVTPGGTAWDNFSFVPRYFDFNVAANRRLFSAACPNSPNRLVPADLSALEPWIVLKGNPTAFLRNRIDNSKWSALAGTSLASYAAIKPC